MIGFTYIEEADAMRVLFRVGYRPLARAIFQGLTEEGHLVDLAITHDMADAVVREAEYDLIILDLGREVGDLSFIREWRRLGKDAPVLVLGAPSQTAEVLCGADDAGVGFLRKPFEFTELLESVAELTSPRRAPRPK